MDNRPIGLFDSGIGGISILDKLRELLPNERYWKIRINDIIKCRKMLFLLDISIRKC